MSKIIKKLGELPAGLDKVGIASLATEDARLILAGQFDLVRTFIELRRYEVYLSTLIGQLQAAATVAIADRPDRKLKYADGTVSVTPRYKWDYSSDNRWVTLNTQITTLKSDLKSLTDQRKALEKLLKLSVDGEVVDPETGEIIEQKVTRREVASYSLNVRL
jgi:hypothetical protein